ncbi:MAG: AIPR family protein [Rhodoferax sp.]|nr:AIPR family protein [Rhodoferax sp.]
MTPLSPQYQEILKRELAAQYVKHLPSLVPNKKSAADNADKQVNRALSAFLLQSALNVSVSTAARAVVDDFVDNGIDALYYESKTETIHLVQAKLKASEEFHQDEAQAFCAGIRLIAQQEYSSFNQNFLNRQAAIEAAMANAEHIQLWIVYTGGRVSNAAKNTIQHLLDDDSFVESGRLVKTVNYFGPDEIAAELLKRNSYEPVNTDLFLANDVHIKVPRITWYGMVDVSDLVALHKDKGKALYERNIRYYLGSEKSDVNRDIQRTLETDPGAFFYLNNGVTALCSDIRAKDKKANRRRLKVIGLSIVNGAQTVASAAEVMAQDEPPNIQLAKVMLTLIQVNADGTFGPRVTRARNSQNPVSVGNFASQDPVQERLRQELKGLGIEYHYRPEALAVAAPNSLLLSEAVIALAWLQADPRYAVWLKSGKVDLYDTNAEGYKALFRNLTWPQLANAVYYSRAVLKLIKSADQSSSGIERLVYRHGAHAIGWSYLKRLRNRIDASSPIEPRTIPAVISASFDTHRQIAFDQYNSLFGGPLAFFKNQTDTTPYLVKVMIQSYDLQDHPAIPALRVAKPRSSSQ